MAVILNIEMPTNCLDCPCCDKDSGWCQVTGQAIFMERPHNCPLVEVRHGHWKGKPIAGYCTVFCSVCGTAFTHNSGNFKFCPNCWAIMDEEAE